MSERCSRCIIHNPLEGNLLEETVPGPAWEQLGNPSEGCGALRVHPGVTALAATHIWSCRAREGADGARWSHTRSRRAAGPARAGAPTGLRAAGGGRDGAGGGRGVLAEPRASPRWPFWGCGHRGEPLGASPPCLHSKPQTPLCLLHLLMRGLGALAVLGPCPGGTLSFWGSAAFPSPRTTPHLRKQPPGSPLTLQKCKFRDHTTSANKYPPLQGEDAEPPHSRCLATKPPIPPCCC